MAEALDKDTFDRVMAEHEKFLNVKFDSLESCVNGIKGAREQAWEKHAQECVDCRKCQDNKYKKLRKIMVAGFIAAALLGASLSQYIGIQHLIGFVIKALTGQPPVGA